MGDQGSSLPSNLSNQAASVILSGVYGWKNGFLATGLGGVLKAECLKLGWNHCCLWIIPTKLVMNKQTCIVLIKLLVRNCSYCTFPCQSDVHCILGLERKVSKLLVGSIGGELRLQTNCWPGSSVVA